MFFCFQFCAWVVITLRFPPFLLNPHPSCCSANRKQICCNQLNLCSAPWQPAQWKTTVAAMRMKVQISASGSKPSFFFGGGGASHYSCGRLPICSLCKHLCAAMITLRVLQRHKSLKEVLKKALGITKNHKSNMTIMTPLVLSAMKLILLTSRREQYWWGSLLEGCCASATCTLGCKLDGWPWAPCNQPCLALASSSLPTGTFIASREGTPARLYGALETLAQKKMYPSSPLSSPVHTMACNDHKRSLFLSELYFAIPMLVADRLFPLCFPVGTRA